MSWTIVRDGNTVQIRAVLSSDITEWDEFIQGLQDNKSAFIIEGPIRPIPTVSGATTIPTGEPK